MIRRIEQLIEVDAVAAELVLLREKPELMPEHKFANGRDDMLPYFNQMWQKDSDTSIEFANQNLKEQVNAAYGNLVEKGLTKTLAEKSTPQKEGMSLLTQLNKLQNLNAEKEKQTQNSDKMITAAVINVGGQNR